MINTYLARVAVGVLTGFLACTAHAVIGGSTTLYGTYWNGDETGYGAGLRLNKSLLDMLYIDGRGGYVEFDQGEVKMIPLEAALNLYFPGPVSPFIGAGAGYYIIDNSSLDNRGGYFGQAGLEIKVWVIGAMAELRYMDLEDDYFDGLSINVGIVLDF